MDRYGMLLINNASKLDAITDSCGEITNLAIEIVNQKSKTSTKALLNKLSEVADSTKIRIEAKKVAGVVKCSLVEFYGATTIRDICNEITLIDNDERTLQDLLDELDSLIGLEPVKNQVQDLISYQRVQKLRMEHNLHSNKNTMHLAFTGNPGTGKTTVARILGRMYKKLGLLSKGHFMEVSRTDLIAGYQGQTALKVKKVIEEAKGGVLFIDEAYSITENDRADSYGRECLTELTKALEDYRDDLVVIVAGYTEPMHRFFESNPGLKSRFNKFIEFDDYSPKELDEILVSMCIKNDYSIDEDAKQKIHKYFEQQIALNECNFANGRLVRNIFDDLVMNHARRVDKIMNPTKADLYRIKSVDFKEDGSTSDV